MNSPLHPCQVREGAVFSEIAGWQVPCNFGDEAGEEAAGWDGVALVDLSHHAKIELAGPDARMFLHNLCTNDVKTLAVGAGCEIFLTTAKARVVVHGWVGHVDQLSGSVLWIDTVAGQAETLRKHLDHFLISEQVEIVDRTAELALLRLCGPKSAKLLPEPLQELPLLHYRRIDWPGIGVCQVRHHRLLARPGYDIFCPAENATKLWEHLRLAGAKPAGIQAHEVWRVEAGLPVFGVDIDENRLAMEVNRPQAISYQKGCYLGQETIVMARDRGQVNRALIRVQAEPGTPLKPGMKLLLGTEEVGQVTSTAYSRHLKQSLGLAYLRRGCQAPGTLLNLEANAGQVIIVVEYC